MRVRVSTCVCKQAEHTAEALGKLLCAGNLHWNSDLSLSTRPQNCITTPAQHSVQQTQRVLLTGIVWDTARPWSWSRQDVCQPQKSLGCQKPEGRESSSWVCPAQCSPAEL